MNNLQDFIMSVNLWLVFWRQRERKIVAYWNGSIPKIDVSMLNFRVLYSKLFIKN